MFEGKEVQILLANAGTGKGNWVECKVPTPQGIRRFGDLKEGDYVFDRLGFPTKILKVYPRGFMDAYKVTLSDGRSTVVSLDHLWNVYRGVYSKEIYTLELGQMLSEGVRKEDNRPNRVLGNPRFYVPSHCARQHEEKKVTVDPYVYGAFIGNGCLTSDYLEFSSDDEETVNKVALLMGFDYKKRSVCNYTWDFFKNGRRVRTTDYFTKAYAKDKYIPDCYKYNSIQTRWELLRGLFDTDGSAVLSEGRLHVSYSTISKRLAEDIKEVLNSLGIVSHIYEDKRDSKNICYNVNVNTTKENKCLLFSLTRKNRICEQASENRRHYDRVAIRSIEKLPEKLEINCIWVDNKEHLYQCDEGIVTHNTRRLIEEVSKELETRRPEELAFVTFTRKGAEEGLRRVCSKLMFEPEDLPYFRTLHSLTFHALNLKGTQMFGRLDQRKFNKEFGYNVNRCEVDTGKVAPTRDSLYLDFYDMERSGALTSKQLAEADIEKAYYNQIVRNYEAYKAREEKVDFFDCLIKYVENGEALPVKVAMIDEAQDITALQWRVIEKAFRKAEKIIIAGDDKQSIYAYSGARPDFLIQLSKQFPVEHLSKSYRIPYSVYKLSVAITNFIGEKTEQKAEPRMENGEGMIMQLNGLERILNFFDESCIKNDPDKTAWYILARNNCFLEEPKKVLEEALIPYWTAEGFFMGGEIMKRLKDYENFKMEGYRDPKKKEDFQRKFGIEDFTQPFTETNLFTEGRKWVYASYIEKYGLKKLEEMCKWNPQVLVSTIHHVKGGECQNCAIMLDTTRKTKGNVFENIDEELRILYVGVTRAKENLFLIDSKNGEGYDKILEVIKQENGLVW